MLRITLPLLALSALGGCNDNAIWFSDNVDLVLDFQSVLDLGLPNADVMHLPYVEGAQLRVYVHDDRRHSSLSDYSLSSLDEEVFSLGESYWDEESDTLIVSGEARGEGITELVLYDEAGHEVDRTEVEVAFPDALSLDAAGPRWVDDPAVPSSVEEPTVLVGGTSTYLVRYYLDGERLYGTGTLEAQGGEAVEAEVEQSFIFEDREWLRLTASTEGEHDVGLYVNGDLLDRVTVDAVGEEAIDTIEIIGQSTEEAEVGDWRVLLGQAWTAEDVPVYGVDYSWQVDGTDEEGEGDLYRYAYDPDQERDVIASFGEHEASGVIYGGEGFVDSSNNVGCATGGPAPVGLLGLLPLLGLTRRRRR